ANLRFEIVLMYRLKVITRMHPGQCRAVPGIWFYSIRFYLAGANDLNARFHVCFFQGKNIIEHGLDLIVPQLGMGIHNAVAPSTGTALLHLSDQQLLSWIVI